RRVSGTAWRDPGCAPVDSRPVSAKDAKPEKPKKPPVKRLTRTDPAPERAPAIIEALEKAHPDAKVALRFSNPLEMLIATILSAQCTDERVNQVTATLFQKYRRPQDYLALPESELAADIRPTGFFNQKAKSIRGAARKIVDEFGGR